MKKSVMAFVFAFLFGTTMAVMNVTCNDNGNDDLKALGWYGDVINTAGYYEMNASCSFAPGGFGIGIGINASGVTLNCRGNTIYGDNSSGPSYGIYASDAGEGMSYNNTLIENCKIYDTAIGISSDGGTNISILNNTIRAAGIEGGARNLYFSMGSENLDNVVIANNTFNITSSAFGNQGTNILFVQSIGAPNVLIVGNTFYLYGDMEFYPYFIIDDAVANISNVRLNDSTHGNTYYKNNSMLATAGLDITTTNAPNYATGGSDLPLLVGLSAGGDYRPWTTMQALYACSTLNASASYVLANDVSINGSTCFSITAANVTLDCQGHSIIGTNSSDTYGIYSNQFNSTVKNCIISNFSTAIYFNGATNGTIQNTSAGTTRGGGHGIYLYDGANYNAVMNNIATASSGNAIYVLKNSNYNTIVNNNGSSASGRGAYISTSSYNTYSNNIATSNSSSALFLAYSSYYNYLANNSITSNSNLGIYIISSSNNTLMGNNATSKASAAAIYLIGSPENILIGNTGTSTSGYGIYLISSSRNALIGNTFSTLNSGYGIYIYNGANNTDNYFENNSNAYAYNGTSQRFYSGTAQNISSKGNLGWWPLLGSDGNNARVQANTSWYNGSSGGMNANWTFNASLTYWYNGQQ